MVSGKQLATCLTINNKVSLSLYQLFLLFYYGIFFFFLATVNLFLPIVKAFVPSFEGHYSGWPLPI